MTSSQDGKKSKQICILKCVIFKDKQALSKHINKGRQNRDAVLSSPPLRTEASFMNKDLQILSSVWLHVSMNRGIPNPNNKTHTYTHNPRREMKISASKHTHSVTRRPFKSTYFHVGWMLQTQNVITKPSPYLRVKAGYCIIIRWKGKCMWDVFEHGTKRIVQMMGWLELHNSDIFKAKTPEETWWQDTKPISI